jgi:branched-subunit amino acid transport protein
MNDPLILMILGMAAVTYGPRLVPFLILDKILVPDWLHRFLRYIPVAAIGALIIPGGLTATPDHPVAAMAGMGFALIYGWLKGGIIIPVLGAVAVTWLVLAG